MENKSFFSVFRNVYLLRYIYNLIKYDENRIKEFSSLNELNKYPYREFITKIVYKGMESLNFGDYFKNGILKVIHFRTNVASVGSTGIPDGVVEVCYYNNGEVCDLMSLPSTVESISIESYMFDYEIPKSINKLIVYPCKNIQLSINSIPSTIKTLSLGSNWDNNKIQLTNEIFKDGLLNLDIRNYCPNSLEYNVFPHSLTVLKVGYPNDKTNLFKFNLPNLKSLYLFSVDDYNYNHQNKQYSIYNGLIPSSVTRLELQIKGVFIKEGSLPSSVIDLSIGDSLKYNNVFKGMLPDNLKSLSLTMYNSNYTIQIGSLPNTLIKLEIRSINGYGLKGEIQEGLLPNSLLTLDLGESYNEIFLPGSLPCNLQTLILGDTYNKPLKPNILPQSLTYLKLSRCYNQPILENTLPFNLKSLLFHLYSNFNHSIEPNILPKSLTELSLPREYSIKINEIEPFAKLSKLEITKKSYDTIFNDNDKSILSSIEYLKIK